MYEISTQSDQNKNGRILGYILICCYTISHIQLNIKHLLDETESNIQFIASGQGNIGRSEAEPNIVLYGCNELDVGRGQIRSNKLVV